MKTNMKVLIGVLALAVIGASVYFSKSELQKGATRRPAGPQPDYEISSIIVDPANPVEGENFKISVTVKNKSSTTAATVPSKTLLHLSGQPLPIATTQPLGPLATEEEVWQTTSTQRRLLIRSCADADRAIAESNERNNCRERTLDLLPPPIQEQPPLPLCIEGQYNCESWTECSAEGSQTGISCMVNNAGTCLIPLGPLTRACTRPPNLWTLTVIINTASPTAGNPVNFSVNIYNNGSTTAPASTATLTISGTSTDGVQYEVYRQNISTPELSAGNTTRVNFEWPSAVEGQYTPRVCADSENVVSERNEGDNCSRVVYRPDSGYTFTVAPAPPPPPPPDCMPDQYTCASWSECSASGSQTGTSCTANSGVSCTLPVTATQSCTYIPPMPDLVIDNILLTYNPQNNIITVQTIIRNAGNLAVTNSNNWRRYIGMAIYLIDSTGTGNLVPYDNSYLRLCTESEGGGSTCTFQYTIQPAISINNFANYNPTYYWRGKTVVRIMVDSSNVVAESNETNNTYDVAIPAEILAIISSPDLYVARVSIINPASPTAGSPVNFSAIIWNNGLSTAPASTATLTINGSSTSADLGEVYRQDVVTPEVATGGSTTVNFEWPSAMEGNFLTNVCADSENVVLEAEERGNCDNRDITVAPAPSE